jgi:hypothetical protein
MEVKNRDGSPRTADRTRITVLASYRRYRSGSARRPRRRNQEGPTMSKHTKYTFFPIVRQGYRPEESFSKGQTKKQTELSDTGTTSVTLDVKAEGEDGTTTKQTGVDLSLYGPGEVTNIDNDQIARLEPEPDTTAFSPNYFPLVEFDNPLLPWLFSPMRADDQGRNRPWLCLVAVPIEETTFKPAGTGPCPVLETPAAQLPDPAESWAWAHAQLVGDQDPKSAFESNSTATVSRLLCPRNLDPTTKYRACIVPTFEAGRRAGLGLDPYPDKQSKLLAWSDEKRVRLPVYHHWEFTTAEEGDFESLARELDPVQLGEDVGFRSVDVSNPGPVDLKLPAKPAEDIGTVGIGGALVGVGADPDTYEESMRSKLRDLLNKPQTVVDKTDYGAVGPPLYGQWHAGVPELEPPSKDSEAYYYPSWFNTLNDDPRYRMVAGYGTQVIREEQERLMTRAWEQFGEIQKANERLRRFQLSERILTNRHEQLSSLSTGSLLAATSPVNAYMKDPESGKTVYGEALESDLSTGMASMAFRRLTRPTGPMARRPGVTLDASNMATRLETGRGPRVTDGLDFTVEQAVSDAGSSPGQSSGGPDSATNVAVQTDGGPGMPDVPAIQPGREGELPTFETGQQPPAGTQAAEPTSPAKPQGEGHDQSPASAGQSESDTDPDIQQALTALDSLDTHARTAERAVSDLSAAVGSDDTATLTDLTEMSPTVVDHCRSIRRNTFDALTRALGKVLADPRSGTLSEDFDRSAANGHLQRLHGAQRRLETAAETAVTQIQAGDPPTAIKRRLDRAIQALDKIERTSEALRSALTPTVMQAMSMTAQTDKSVTGPRTIGTSSPAAPQELSKEKIRNTILTELDPQVALPKYAGQAIGIPNLDKREDPVEEVMAAPSFTTPTYELLADLDQEYFLPGASDVPRDSVGVLQTNPRFIEAFLAGLNHEFARELQWRKFPTDRRGTYFRRFWDRRGNPNVDPSNPEQMADIEPMHTWDENDLGNNSPRKDHAKVILMVRGELLRRYPNTDIFVAKAVGEKGDRVPALPGTHVTRDDAANDPNVKFHVFRGTLEPDITFFGFDLSPDEALYDPYHKSSTAEPNNQNDEGWFFVLQEPPGETRFGMDVGTTEDVGSTPLGITHNGTTEQTTESDFRGSGAEHGWNALSWAHLVETGSKKPEDVKYVDVDGSRPGKEGWTVEEKTSHLSETDGKNEPLPTYDSEDAAEWGFNSAHMARATWQLPVRISIHADDMMPEEPPTDDTDWQNVQFDTPTTATIRRESQ